MAASLLSLGFKARLAAAAAASFRSDVAARFFAFNSAPRVREAGFNLTLLWIERMVSGCCGTGSFKVRVFCQAVSRQYF